MLIEIGLSEAGLPEAGFPEAEFLEAGFSEAEFLEAEFPEAKFLETTSQGSRLRVVSISIPMKVQNRFCGMRVGAYNQGGMREIKKIIVGYGMKSFWRDRDVLLFVGGMWNFLKFKAG